MEFDLKFLENLTSEQRSKYDEVVKKIAGNLNKPIDQITADEALENLRASLSTPEGVSNLDTAINSINGVQKLFYEKGGVVYPGESGPTIVFTARNS